MNVLHLSSEPSWRGGEQQIAYLIHHSNKLGVNNFIACKKGSAFENYCIINKLDYESFSFKSGFDLKTAIGLIKIYKKNKIDLVHIHSSKSHSNILFANLLYPKKILMVLSRRVDFQLKSNFLSRWKYNHKSIKKIICVSKAIKNIILPHIKEKSKVITVHSGVDILKFNDFLESKTLREEFNIPSNYKIIGNTSAIAPHKDYTTFVNTAQLLCNERDDLVFFIIGEGVSKERIRNLVKEKGLTERIFFTGFRKDIEKILPSLDIFLITSNEEGLGTSVLDAFAAKVPTVATNAGGIPEMITHEVTGMLCQISDSKGLSESIKSLLAKPELYREIQEKAFYKVQEFNYNLSVEKIVKVYHEIID